MEKFKKIYKITKSVPKVYIGLAFMLIFLLFFPEILIVMKDVLRNVYQDLFPATALKPTITPLLTQRAPIRGAGPPNYLFGAVSIFVSENYVYVTSAVDDVFSIWEISNPPFLNQLAIMGGAGEPNYLDGAMSVYVSGNYAYVASYDDNAISLFNLEELIRK